MEFHSCSNITSDYTLAANGRIDTNEHVITMCCEPIVGIPGVPLMETAGQTLAQFTVLRAQVMAEHIKGITNGVGQKCYGCSNLVKGEWQIAPQITMVNLSMYPSPCQCKCIYCNLERLGWVKSLSDMNAPKIKEAYERLIDLVTLADEAGFVKEDARWQLSPGEITIHPYRERLLELVRGKKVRFLTNGFLFDAEIARCLKDNAESSINLSIDSGTPGTWKKVKGVNNFEHVMDNLVRYHNSSARPGQITMKYIVLPDINDTYEDYSALVEIMKILEVNELAISRDFRYKYRHGEEQHMKLLGAAAYLFAICKKNGFDCTFGLYTFPEQEEILKLAGEVLQKSLV